MDVRIKSKRKKQKNLKKVTTLKDNKQSNALLGTKDWSYADYYEKNAGVDGNCYFRVFSSYYRGY